MRAWSSPDVPSLPVTGPAVRVHDTASGTVVETRPEGPARMYVCGITPYDATHMGHAATYVGFDLLHRAWRNAGHAVTYVQNVTDVDDPLLERAAKVHVDWVELAERETQLFRDDMESLRVLAPDHYVGAVESISLIVPEVERLVSLGLAYKVQGTNGEPDGDVYYDVEAAGKQSASPDAWSLGSISGLAESEMLELFAERGGDPGRSGKRQALDPLLWRVAREGEPSWPGGSLGAGRPGWHIECTVIAQKYLPSPFTVQGGGSDLIFPHHEMGAGHAFSLAGVPLAKHYAHAGMVGLDGEKMSKSKGNLVLVSKLRAAGEEPAAIRLAILAHHYRSDWSWTDEGFAAAKADLAAWRHALDHAPQGSAAPLVEEMRAALAADLNAPAAIAAVSRWARQANDGGAPASISDQALVRDAVNALLGVQL